MSSLPNLLYRDWNPPQSRMGPMIFGKSTKTEAELEGVNPLLTMLITFAHILSIILEGRPGLEFVRLLSKGKGLFDTCCTRTDHFATCFVRMSWYHPHLRNARDRPFNL